MGMSQGNLLSSVLGKNKWVIPLPLNVWSWNQQQQHYLGDFRNMASHSVPQTYDIQICVSAWSYVICKYIKFEQKCSQWKLPLGVTWGTDVLLLFMTVDRINMLSAQFLEFTLFLLLSILKKYVFYPNLLSKTINHGSE